MIKLKQIMCFVVVVCLSLSFAFVVSAQEPTPIPDEEDTGVVQTPEPGDTGAIDETGGKEGKVETEVQEPDEVAPVPMESNVFSAPASDEVGVQLYSGSWKSGIGIQNLTDADNAITVQFFNASTGAEQAYQYSDTLDALKGVELYLPELSDSDLASGSYAAVVSSEGEVGTIVTSTDYDYNMADSYNGMSGATEFFVPGIYNNHNSWTSQLFVQNTDANPIHVYVEISGKNLSTNVAVSAKTFGPLTIPGNATASFDTGSNSPFNFDTQLGSSFLGSAKVTNTEGKEMAVVLYNTRVSGSQQTVLSYRGMTTDQDADTFLAAPVIYKNFNNGGWRTGINVQNVDDSDPVDARITVTSQNGTVAFVDTQTIVAGKSYEWYLPSIATIPDNFIGSAKVEVIDSGTGTIVGTATSTNYSKAKTLSIAPSGTGVAFGYIMPSRSSGGTTVSAPTAYKVFGTGGWNSSLVVANVGTVPVSYTLKFASDANSTVFNQTIPAPSLLPAGESKEFYLPNAISGVTVPNGFKGSILVQATSSSGTPQIAGTIQHVNYGRGVGTVYLASVKK